LIGILTAGFCLTHTEFKGEAKKYNSFWQKGYVEFIEIVQKLFFKRGAGLYENTTKEQFAKYLETNTTDGEIIFLAVDPNCKIKGIGIALLNALEGVEKDKTIFLHTDDACTYQFYEHRGFERVQEKDIVLEMPKGKVPLKCLIYSKII